MYKERFSSVYIIDIEIIKNINNSEKRSKIYFNKFDVNNLDEKNSKIINDKIIKIFTKSSIIENTIKNNIKDLDLITMKLH